MYSILGPHESGCREKHKAATTLVANDIVSPLDKGKYYDGLFVALSKAFDTLEHFLLQKLCSSGLYKGSHLVLELFISDTSKCGSRAFAEFLPSTQGAPEASIIDTVLLTPNNNYIVSPLDNFWIDLYVDDTIIYCFASPESPAFVNCNTFNTQDLGSLHSLISVLNANKTTL